MQRGCIISIIAASVVILIASVVLRTFFMPEYQAKGTSRIIFVIEAAMAEHNKDFGSYPAGKNEAVTKVLLGQNSRGKNYLPEKSIVIRDGMMVDLWKQPLKVIANEPAPRVISAGENGIFHDNDDVTGENASNEFQD